MTGPQHARKQPRASPKQSKELAANDTDTFATLSTISYTLPEDKNNKTMGTQSPNYTDEREGDRAVWSSERHRRKFLMFHGLILRSQLIELIKNKVFFDESAGVSELYYNDHFFVLFSAIMFAKNYFSFHIA